MGLALRRRLSTGGDGRLKLWPATRLGKWAVGLGVAFFVFMLGWSVVPGGAFIGLACAVAGGIVALVAILRHGERAIAVLAMLVPFLLAVVFVLAELLIGHD